MGGDLDTAGAAAADGVTRAVLVTAIDQLVDLPGDVSRLYFGHEFCEKRLPSIRQLDTALHLCAQTGWKFTLVTPYVSPVGLARVARLLARLEARVVTRPNGSPDWTGSPQSAHVAEVVVNDYGVLSLLAAEHPRLEPVLGRLMSKQHRDPRIMRMMAAQRLVRPRGSEMVVGVAVPEEIASYYRESQVNVPDVREILRSLGVRRVELDLPLHGIELHGLGERTKGSLYTPWGFITTTRRCSGNPFAETEPFACRITTCRQECREFTMKLSNPGLPVPVYKRGNTLLYCNPRVPSDEWLIHHGVDRLILEPDLPV